MRLQRIELPIQGMSATALDKGREDTYKLHDASHCLCDINSAIGVDSDDCCGRSEGWEVDVGRCIEHKGFQIVRVVKEEKVEFAR